LFQLSFPFQISTKASFYKETDFLLFEENQAAINFLKKFFVQGDFSRSQFPSIIIRGGKCSGKTHLLHIFAKKYPLEFLLNAEISDLNPASFFQANKFYVLENIDEIADEELVLRLINSAFEAKAFLIVTMRYQVQFKLKDLMSRLKNIFAVEIKNPSYETIKQLLSNGFARKQIRLPSKIINFIADNIERSYEAVFNAEKIVEFHCQESGKNLTMKQVKELFSNVNFR
jgi:chromosomal replication initiation ATPase DnaA